MNPPIQRHVSLPIATVATVGTAIVAALASYFGTVDATNSRIGDTNTTLAVMQSKQETDEKNIAGIQYSLNFIHDQVIRVSIRLGVPVYPDQAANTQ